MYQITKALANLRKMKKKSAILSVDDMKAISSTIDLLEKAEMKGRTILSLVATRRRE